MISMFYPTLAIPLLCFVSSGAAVEYTNSTVLADGAYNVSWKFDNDTDMFYFKVRAKAVGWIGFGVTRLEYSSDPWNEEGMDGYDVVVGGVLSNNTAYHKDYYTNGWRFPELDEQQDWDQTNAIESDGFTTLEYERKRDTSDNKVDNEIKPGYMFLVWAYHNSSDEFQSAANKHTASGRSSRMELIHLVENNTPVKEVFYTHSPRGGASCMVIGNLFLALLAVIFLY